jgi:glycosyltransferase involved in cell wall biosynthesis
MLLSIITINLNNCRGLAATIESLDYLKDTDFELIVVDGNSSDDSLNYILKNKFKIAKWVSEIDEGIYDAMNKGVEMASGSYCLFLNSGDTLSQNGALVSALEYCDTQNHLVIGSLELINHSVWIIPDKIDIAYFFKSTLPHQSTLIKRSLLLKYPFDKGLKIVGDWCFFLRVFKYEGLVRYVKFNEIIANFDMNGISSQSDSELLIANERNKVLSRELGDGIIRHISHLNHLEEKFSNYHIQYMMQIIEFPLVLKFVNALLGVIARILNFISK